MSNQSLILSIVLLSLLNLAARAGDVIDVADYGVVPSAADNTLALREALEAVERTGAKRLVFPKGRYDFKGDFAHEMYDFISNNDEGMKRVIFPLLGMKGLTIDGQGSDFVFHGRVNPFIIDDASEITFENFSVDFERSFHSEAIILADPEQGLDVEIREDFPFVLADGLLLFTDGAGGPGMKTTVDKDTIYGSKHILEFDTERRETAYMADDFFFEGGQGYAAESLGGRKVRLLSEQLTGTVGNTIVFGPDTREFPGFVVSDSRDVRFHKVTLHHTGGMGILGQRSHNITVDHCRVTPSRGRMLSTSADATHFVNCTGKITLSNNLFENQKDDATNIHGIYMQVLRLAGEDEALLGLRHHQQRGFDFLKPGTSLELVRGASMITYAEAIVKEAEWLNHEVCRVRFEKTLPEKIKVGDAVAELRDYPEILIADNIIRNNRARGMLLNCRGKTVVENNVFHSPGTAILFEGDASHWFEQGGVRDCTIRNNVFDNCMFGVWGDAVIGVRAGITEDRERSRYNRNVLIEGNTFRVFDEVSLLNAYCVDGITWRNNKVEKTKAYPPREKPLKRFVINYCDNVVIEE